MHATTALLICVQVSPARDHGALGSLVACLPDIFPKVVLFVSQLQAPGQSESLFQKPTIVGPRSSAAGDVYAPPPDGGALSFQFQPMAEADAAARRKNLPDWLRAEIEKRQLKAAGTRLNSCEFQLRKIWPVACCTELLGRGRSLRMPQEPAAAT